MDNSVCFEKFKDYLTNVKKASSNTLSSYLRDIRQFGEYLDSHETVGYTEADEEVLNGYISWLRGMGKSVATVSRSIASLKCFYTFLILQRIVSENPTGKLVPDKCEQKLPQILTSSEVELLLEQPECTDFKGYRDKAMLELLYATGIRVSELISLNVTDVNLTAGAIRCISHDKERFIPLYPAAIRALSEYMEFVRPQMLARKDETSLFVNVSGERMSRQGFWKIIKSYQAKAHICWKTARISVRSRKCSAMRISAPRRSIRSSSKSSSRTCTRNRIRVPDFEPLQLYRQRGVPKVFWDASLFFVIVVLQ